MNADLTQCGSLQPPHRVWIDGLNLTPKDAPTLAAQLSEVIADPTQSAPLTEVIKRSLGATEWSAAPIDLFLHEVCTSWITVDPQKALEWVRSLPAGGSRDGLEAVAAS